MSKRFLAILAILIVVFVAIFAINNKSSNSSGSTLTNNKEGQGKDGVSLVEYGDYECPYCGQYNSVVEQVVQEYSKQITFQFRNFPLTEEHPNAFAAARAALAAGMQNKFWQMHDLLYQTNVEYYNSGDTISSWVSASDPLTYFNKFASQLGLNTTKFNQDYSSSKVDNQIEADMNEGNKLGINATPTFFLDGKKIQPVETVASFQKYINAAIAEKTKTSKAQ